MKVIRVDDVIHEQLKKEAKAEGRTLQWWVEYKLTNTGAFLTKRPSGIVDEIPEEWTTPVSEQPKESPLEPVVEYDGEQE